LNLKLNFNDRKINLFPKCTLYAGHITGMSGREIGGRLLHFNEKFIEIIKVIGSFISLLK